MKFPLSLELVVTGISFQQTAELISRVYNWTGSQTQGAITITTTTTTSNHSDLISSTNFLVEGSSGHRLDLYRVVAHIEAVSLSLKGECYLLEDDSANASVGPTLEELNLPQEIRQELLEYGISRLSQLTAMTRSELQVYAKSRLGTSDAQNAYFFKVVISALREAGQSLAPDRSSVPPSAAPSGGRIAGDDEKLGDLSELEGEFRTYLFFAGIDTIGQLCAHTRSAAVRRLGTYTNSPETVVAQIERCLASLGRAFQDEPAPSGSAPSSSCYTPSTTASVGRTQV